MEQQEQQLLKPGKYKLDVMALMRHPAHKEIYQSRSVEDLKESIEATKVIAEIIVNTKGIVLSGWRRVLATRMIGQRTIPARVIHIDERDETMFLIEQNNTRVKTYSEKAGELQTLIDWYGTQQGRRTDLEKWGKRINSNEFFAEKLGISDQEVKKLKKIIADKVHGPTILMLLDKGDIDITHAYKLLNRKEDSDRDPGAEGPSNTVDLGLIIGFHNKAGMHLRPGSPEKPAPPIITYRPQVEVSYFQCQFCEEMNRMEKLTGEVEEEVIEQPDYEEDKELSPEEIAEKEERFRKHWEALSPEEQDRITAFTQQVMEARARKEEEDRKKFNELFGIVEHE